MGRIGKVNLGNVGEKKGEEIKKSAAHQARIARVARTRPGGRSFFIRGDGF